jgi:LuxR family maltose regulon positive regulatory protein
MERAARKGVRNRKLITVYLLQALVGRAQGDKSRALARVKDALHLAAPENYSQEFLNQGRAIAELLPGVRHVSPDFVDELTIAFQAQASEATKRDGMWPEGLPLSLPAPASEATLESISERELQVLRLVANGLSNRDIAQALFVTVGTVKKHLNNLFGKLGVKSRTQAVARARDLNLLP